MLAVDAATIHHPLPSFLTTGELPLTIAARAPFTSDLYIRSSSITGHIPAGTIGHIPAGTIGSHMSHCSNTESHQTTHTRHRRRHSPCNQRPRRSGSRLSSGHFTSMLHPSSDLQICRHNLADRNAGETSGLRIINGSATAGHTTPSYAGDPHSGDSCLLSYSGDNTANNLGLHRKTDLFIKSVAAATSPTIFM